MPESRASPTPTPERALPSRARPGARVVATSLTAVLTFATAASDAGAAAPRRTAASDRVASITVTFADTSRSTPATPSEPEDDQRVLVTTIRYPSDAIGPRPLIVLAHGLNGHPHQLDELIDAWADAGFIVAAPRFPRTNLDADGRAILHDAAEYPGDLSFVISRVLAMSRSDTNGLHGLVDPTRIGAAGISLGGMAVYGLVSNTCCIDRRVDAALLMSAVHPAFPGGRYRRQSMPVMLIHGDADTGYRYSARTYPMLAPPKWFITLRGGRHGPPFEDAPDEHDEFVRATTIAFWQRYLDDDRDAGRRIVSAVDHSAGKATLQRDTR
jgi:poly(3-hydroxybutyrate) depolymerase